jgi:hypothetical protein
MGRKPIGTSSTRLLIPLAMVALTGFGLSVASAQTGSQSPTIRPANARSAVATSGSGQYYFEFRSRQAWDYGHTFVVFGHVGEPPSKNNVAGLSPKGDDPQMWLMGHYVPVPSDTGWTDGDLEDKYITARYRILVTRSSTTEPSLTSASCRPNRQPGAWSSTTATPLSPTSQTSWVSRHHLQPGFIRKSS